MNILNETIRKIEEQQPKERTAVWTVGEQLKDILRSDPSMAENVLHDLDIKEMSLTECEKKIRAYADKHKTGNFACVIPAEAEKIIREFYGLGEGTDCHALRARNDSAGGKTGVIDLENFF